MNIKIIHWYYKEAMRRTGNEAMVWALRLQRKGTSRYAQELADKAINHAIDTME